MEPKLEAICNKLRAEIGELGAFVRKQMDHSVFMEEQCYPGQHAEMKANIMLTFRHLEDARMRVGKIMQAADDGVSILDKQPK